MFSFKEFFLEIGVTTKELENTLTLVMTEKRTPSGTRLASTDSESWTAIIFLLEAKPRPPLKMKKSPKNMNTNITTIPNPNPHSSTHLILPISNPNFWPETWPDILPASLRKWRPLPQPRDQDYPQPHLLWEFFHEDKFNWKDSPPDLTLLSNQTKLDNILSYLFLWKNIGQHHCFLLLSLSILCKICVRPYDDGGEYWMILKPPVRFFRLRFRPLETVWMTSWKYWKKAFVQMSHRKNYLKEYGQCCQDWIK